MQGLFVTVLAGAVFFASTASAVTKAESCRVMGAAMGKAAPSIRVFQSAVSGARTAQAAVLIDGDEKTALARLEEKRALLEAALNAYATELEDTAYLLQKCGR